MKSDCRYNPGNVLLCVVINGHGGVYCPGDEVPDNSTVNATEI